MVDEDAGGLSTAAIEAAIACYEDEVLAANEATAARAELAALQAAAQANAIQYGQLLYQRERSAALAAALGCLVLDGWAGWVADPDTHLWVCRYCAAQGEMHGAYCPPGHKVDCPLATARALLAGDAGPGAAGARAASALLDAAARYQDAWRALAAGDVDDGAKVAHILDMHEAREDLFDAVEVALRAGGAGEEG